MAFFSKLKDRLFKSSSKLDEGLDAIVDDGGTVEPDAAPEPQAEAPQLAPTPEPAAETPPVAPEPPAAPEPIPEPVIAREPAPAPVPAAEASPAPVRPALAPQPEPLALDEVAEEPAAKPGILARMMGRRSGEPEKKRVLDDDMLEQLEELLIASDMGVDPALRVTANMAEGRLGR
ncbi:MAG: signal recognition particle receptor subunit alpha, partial [Pseudomonadota bacterium]